MGELKKGIFDVPELDFSNLGRVYTEAERAAFDAKIKRASSREEHIKFIEDIEAHPEHLLGWDMDISFDEYARRVRAGEYD